MKKFLLLTLLVISSLLHAENWTGTGWALKKGYIVTNFHCVDGAKSIVVETTESHYSAKVVATDPSSDLAIIKIDDDKFGGFGEIPYSIERKQCEVGETVWTLGFPMTSIMGDEVKFTDGKISAKTGYMGDLSTYQITVPIHPGNSGGPLFNKNGDIVGITSSGLDKQLADNVNYAIKTNYLLNLIESALSIEIIPNGSVRNLALTEYVRRNKKYVFLLHFSSELNENTVAGVQMGETYPQEPIEENSTEVQLFHFNQIAKDRLEIVKYIGTWEELEIPSFVMQNGNKFIITRIGNNAFEGCTFLKSITIPNSITNIGSRAFYNCSSLTSIDIPNSVTSIGEEAFSNCASLIFFGISASTNSIGNNLLQNCNNLTTITISASSIKQYCDSEINKKLRNSENERYKYGERGYKNRELLISGIKTIEIVIPDSTNKLNDYTFYGCNSLKSIIIPSSVNELGKYTFYGCTSLDSIILPPRIESLDEATLAYCTSFKTIKIPQNVTHIATGALYACASLKALDIPLNVTEIGNYAFGDCSALKAITIPKNVIKMGEGIFESCNSLTTIVWNAQNCTVQESFEGVANNIKSFIFGDDVKVIPDCLCKGMSEITSIEIPAGIRSIGKNVFWGCQNLKTIYWNAENCEPTSWEEHESSIRSKIYGYYFSVRNPLRRDFLMVHGPFINVASIITSFHIGENVQNIPKYLCHNMSNLTNISIHSDVQNIGYGAFSKGPGTYTYGPQHRNIQFYGKVLECQGAFTSYAKVTIYVPQEHLKYYKSLRTIMGLKKAKVSYKTF